VNHLDTLFFN